MRGLKLMLFGIAVILASGFLVVADAAAEYSSQSGFVWGLFLGLFLCFVGLLLGSGGERRTDTGSDGRDDDGGDGPTDAEDGPTDDVSGGDDSTDDDDAPDRDPYPESFFPPM